MPIDPLAMPLPPDVHPDVHPDVEALLHFFQFAHLPSPLQSVSAECSRLAHAMAGTLPQNTELLVGLRKLLEAKDCFVRARL